jgi:hypothetical protein
MSNNTSPRSSGSFDNDDDIRSFIDCWCPIPVRAYIARLAAGGATNSSDIPDDLFLRIEAAISRIAHGEGAMRVPADNTDPDLVLTECRDQLAALQRQISTLRSEPDRLASLLPEAARHEWDATGERCVRCGDKDWMGGPCKPLAQGSEDGEAHPNRADILDWLNVAHRDELNAGNEWSYYGKAAALIRRLAAAPEKALMSSEGDWTVLDCPHCHRCVKYSRKEASSGIAYRDLCAERDALKAQWAAAPRVVDGAMAIAAEMDSLIARNVSADAVRSYVPGWRDKLRAIGPAASGTGGGVDLGMARHWIDRYAAGIDDEPQMDLIAEAFGVELPASGEHIAASVTEGKA